MAITLEQFAADCHAALKSQPGTPGREKVRDLVKQALADPEFVATYIPPGTPERHLLYEDAGTRLRHPGARLCRAEGQQAARSRSVLGDLRPGRRRDDHDRLGLRRAADRQRRPARRRSNHDYVMKPGDAYLYDVGVLHSPERKGDTRLLRIEGLNMAKVKRFPYEAVSLSQAAAD